ncbi:MAG: tyrosine-type recombinase/integrase, partial [Thermodesulfovibrionales bacterium]
WGWFWLFPAQGLSLDPESKMLRRNHINAIELETAFRRAAQTADTPKGATVHTLRASFANHLIESGCAIQTVLELLGLSDTKAGPVAHTRILSVRSPLDSDRELRY